MGPETFPGKVCILKGYINFLIQINDFGPDPEQSLLPGPHLYFDVTKASSFFLAETIYGLQEVVFSLPEDSLHG